MKPKLLSFALAFAFLLLPALACPVFAETSSASYKIQPNKGVVIVGEEFYVDVYLATNNNPISLARVGLHFDADKLQVTQVQYDSIDNNTGKLFCSYPQENDQYIVDNENGQIVVTGFASGTTACPYFNNSGSTGDIFVRIHFRPTDTGSASVTFSYNGKDDSRYSAIMSNGSPPVIVLSSRPSGANFTVISEKPTPTSGLPNTGTVSSSLLVAGGFLLAGSLVFLGFQLRRKR